MRRAHRLTDGQLRCVAHAERIARARSLPVKYIQLVNEGEVKMRCRGGNAEQLMQILKNERKKVLELVKSVSVATKTPYLMMSVKRYQDTHDQRTPQQDGLPTVTRLIGGRQEEVVLLRKLAQGEWDLDITEEEKAQERETHDASDKAVRLDQMEKKFTALSGKVSDLEVDPSKIVTLAEHSANLALVAADGGRGADEGTEEGSDGDHHSEGHSSLEAEDALLDDLLGGPTPDKAATKAKGNRKPAPKAKASASGSGRPATKASVEKRGAPSAKPPAGALTPSPAKPKGPGAVQSCTLARLSSSCVL